jgi:hypothetical protein
MRTIGAPWALPSEAMPPQWPNNFPLGTTSQQCHHGKEGCNHKGLLGHSRHTQTIADKKPSMHLNMDFQLPSLSLYLQTPVVGSIKATLRAFL